MHKSLNNNVLGAIVFVVAPGPHSGKKTRD
jgi:hypothetical protein